MFGGSSHFGGAGYMANALMGFSLCRILARAWYRMRSLGTKKESIGRVVSLVVRMAFWLVYLLLARSQYKTERRLVRGWTWEEEM